MGIETERKFLVKNNSWRKHITTEMHCLQGYLSLGPACVVRVRLMNEGAFLSIKSAGAGISRSEFEYAVPAEEAQEMLDALAIRPLIEKMRYHVYFAGMLWEIDEFSGDNIGLIIAEIELGSPEQVFARPDWLGEEVSDDPRYYNAALVKMPYRSW